MAGLGAPELLIVLTIVLVVFGGKKLPQLARSLGSAKREFEHGSSAPEPRREASPVAPLPPLPAARLEQPSPAGDAPASVLGGGVGTGHPSHHDAG